jgi:hypothetical protein
MTKSKNEHIHYEVCDTIVFYIKKCAQSDLFREKKQLLTQSVTSLAMMHNQDSPEPLSGERKVLEKK